MLIGSELVVNAVSEYVGVSDRRRLPLLCIGYIDLYIS